jgi:hypothetical protein
MDRETGVAFQGGQAWPYFKCPYHAKVMNAFDESSSGTVVVPNGG